MKGKAFTSQFPWMATTLERRCQSGKLYYGSTTKHRPDHKTDTATSDRIHLVTEMESVEGKPFRFTGFILTNRGVADPNGTQPNILSKDDLNMDIVAGTVDVLEIIQRILRKQLS